MNFPFISLEQEVYGLLANSCYRCSGGNWGMGPFTCDQGVKLNLKSLCPKCVEPGSLRLGYRGFKLVAHSLPGLKE